MKNLLNILLITFIITFCSCGKHDRINVKLQRLQLQKEVIYKTEKADFYIDYNYLLEYCEKENNGEPNDIQYKQIINYIQSDKRIKIIIPDTLGTKVDSWDKKNRINRHYID